jgi:hypothetical protein
MGKLMLATTCLCIFTAMLTLSKNTQAQQQEKKNQRILVYQAGFQTGFIFAHSVEVQNTSGARPRTFEFSSGFWRNDSAMWNSCRCYTLQSLSLAYHDYDNDILGRAVSTSYVLEPIFRLTNRSSISLRVKGGLAYLTNPYHAQDNPTNQSYSTSISAYLTLGTGYWWRINDRWQIGTNVLYQHISNGGLRQPNKGINWPTVGIDVNYSLQPRLNRSFSRSLTANFSDRIRWDVGLFGVAKRVGGQADGRGLRYLVAGATLQAARQVGRISNFSVGSEISWDDALGSQLRKDLVALDPWRVSALIGHEFILGRFLFSQRLGIYLHQAGGYFDPWFHRWGIAYRITNHWMLGINLNAHRHVADYTDMRLTYSF